MRTNDGALGRLARAQATLRQASALWDGADLSSVEISNALLEELVIHLREFRDAIELGTLAPTDQMRRAVMDLRDQIRRLTRVVDASSAFVQGLAVYAGIRSSTYNASGQIEDANLLPMQGS